jgi:response regulator RpfG family c-di-GMP phosphodiesterase
MAHTPPSSIAEPAGRAGRALGLRRVVDGSAAELLDRLGRLRLLDGSRVDAFLAARIDRDETIDSEEALGRALTADGIVTRYQLDRVQVGATHGLVLGPYRVVDELGSGGMGAVFLAEHAFLKRRVALKVLPVDDGCPPSVRQRFYAEMRVLAELAHPNVVAAIDAGEAPGAGPSMPELIYLVMEFVEGGDLHQFTVANGPCPVGVACDYVRQAAAGLQAAHDRHLIHRDLKPSNLLRTPAGQIKLVDFGLARQFSSTLTDPRCLLGSVEFMAPEQSHDPSAVGKEADVYGLGATLFWLLTGEAPYPATRNVGAALRALQRDPPRRLRELAPDSSPVLQELIAHLLDRNPLRRPASPMAVVHALAPFISEQPIGGVAVPPGGESMRRALIVDDDPNIRSLHRCLLEPMLCECTEAADGAAAVAVARRTSFDLVLLDLNLPDLDGYEVSRQLREQSRDPHLKILVASGRGDPDELSEALRQGADDYIAKPYQPRQLAAKVRHALRLREAQRRGDRLAEQLRNANRQLQESLAARDGDVRQAHDALLFTMGKMAESRDGETPGHLRRLQAYAGALGRQAATERPWDGLVDDRFLEVLDRCTPLHDIGKIGLPEDVLMKPGALTPSERLLVETHPLIGDRILEALGREHGAALEFLGVARSIVRCHHERWDGKGYPDRLSGEAIPAAARLVAVADVYDALRRRRSHKPALDHLTAVRIISKESSGQFDPSLVRAFVACEGEFERIFREASEPGV